MLFKTISSVLLSLGLVFPVLASPYLQERQEFCRWAAKNTEAAAQARQVLKMTDVEFEEKAMVYYMSLLMQGVPQQTVVEIMEMLLEGWESGLPPEEAAKKAYEGCLNRKNV